MWNLSVFDKLIENVLPYTFEGPFATETTDLSCSILGQAKPWLTKTCC